MIACTAFYAKPILRLAIAVSAILLSSLLDTNANAQSGPDNLPKEMIAKSEGGVDLLSGQFVYSNTDIPDAQGLPLVRHSGIPGKSDFLTTVFPEFDQPFSQFSHNFDVFVVERSKPPNPPSIVEVLVSEGGRSRSFDASASSSFFTASNAVGTWPDVQLEAINHTSTNRQYVYTSPDGRKIYFRGIAGGDCQRGRGRCAYAEKIVDLDGSTMQFTYTNASTGTGPTALLRRVSDNKGNTIIFEQGLTASGKYRVSKACSFTGQQTPPAANACPSGSNAVTYTYSTNGRMSGYSDASGAFHAFTSTFDKATADATVSNPSYSSPYQYVETYTNPGDAVPYLSNTIERSQTHEITKTQAYANGASYNYAYTITDVNPDAFDVTRGNSTRSDGSFAQARLAILDRPGTRELTGYGVSTGPSLIGGGPARLAQTADYCFPITVSGIAGSGCAITYAPLSISTSDGRSESYTYNPSAQGKVSQIRTKAKAGSGNPDIVRSFTYDCLPQPCKVSGATDGLGHQTNYTWDPVHRSILTETRPAASVGGVRPQKRYSYAQFYPQYRNSAGTLITSPLPIWKLTAVSECRSTASCVNTADETRTTYTYTPVGLYPATVTIASGDGVLSATTSWTYDDRGNKITEDGPLPGTADTRKWRYDVERQVVGEIGPDPDGTGARLHQASRNTYDVAGRLTSTEVGTVVDQSDTAWSNFIPLEKVATTYDIQGRKTSQIKSAGGTNFHVTHFKYDAVGRLQCTAVRMDPAQWLSQTDACTPQLGGPNGPDRITRLTYDSADRVLVTQEAVGTDVQSDEETKTFAPSGQITSIKDGENNITTYEYDGHDRLLKTRFPVPALAANASSTTDYEQLTYDANGNITQRRLRDGLVHNMAFDNLNRQISFTPPAEHQILYSYDLLGQRLVVARPADGVTSTFTYDALGRTLSEGQTFGGMTYQYDLAGRRTRSTWSDGFFVNMVYDVTGALTSVQENGAVTGIGLLATYAYDNLGRRSSLVRGNGTTTNYTYDGISRLSNLSHDMAGTASDVSATFAYNPASQISQYTRNNDSYRWQGHYNVNRTYGTNGLNQLTSAGAVSLGYDGRGNLTTSGPSSFAYTSLNQMKSAPGVTMYYDGLGRLIEYDTATSTRFFYDGVNSAAEVANPSGAILRRYVHAMGEDEPIVWYEGAGTTDRRWLHADERGSIIGLSNSAGTSIAINAYDEYGIPAATNIGRYGYTGQMWLAELGMYNYKARIYSPTLGRFMQTDPIGYADGINWYDYVGGDPVSRSDPTGTQMDSRHIGEAMARIEASGGPKVEKQAQTQAKSGAAVVVGAGAVLIPGGLIVTSAANLRRAVELVRVILSVAGVKLPSQPINPPRPPIVIPAAPRSVPTGGRKPPEGKSMTDDAKPTGSKKPKVGPVQKPNRD